MLDKLILERLDLVINQREYFLHYCTILMNKRHNIYINMLDDLENDLEKTIERKIKSDNSFLPLSYSPIANPDNLKNELIKIRKNIKRKVIINNLLN